MRGAEVEGIVGCSSRSKILRHRTLRAGVTSKAHLARQNFLREVHGCRDMVDGKDPAGAGNVPEELVVVLEKAELAARGIGDAITLKAGGHKRVLAAQVDAHAVAVVFNARLNRFTIVSGRQQRKAHHVTVPQPIGVASGKVSVDTVANQVSGAVNANQLVDEHGSVILDLDGRVVKADALRWRRRDRREQEHAGQSKKASEISKGWPHSTITQPRRSSSPPWNPGGSFPYGANGEMSVHPGQSWKRKFPARWILLHRHTGNRTSQNPISRSRARARWVYTDPVLEQE